MQRNAIRQIEWPTMGLILLCYLTWFALALPGSGLPWYLWIPSMALCTALYWSLVHEAVHGHPTSSCRWNAALVWLPISWVYPYGRFRDGHLRHHSTGELTDPFDDPESWYLARSEWDRHSPAMKRLLACNNTLAGRMTIGPMLVLWRVAREDLAGISCGGEGRKSILVAWSSHLAGVAALLALLSGQTSVPPAWFALAAYCSMSLILIRTFLEHQAGEVQGERTVVIEDRGPLAFLFLFNNLHIVHHVRPGLPWYRLPGFYRRHRRQFLRRNNGYVYDSYGQIFRKYLFRPKEPVAHPRVI